MRTETAPYLARRLLYVNQPQFFVRFFHTPVAGSASEYAFSRDFAMGTILSPTIEKLDCVQAIKGNPQRVDPIAGRSDIGVLTIELVDVDMEITKYIANNARPLAVAITLTGGGSFDFFGGGLFFPTGGAGVTQIDVVGSIAGYPSKGTVTITEGSAREDFTYTGTTQVSPTVGRFTGVTRAARGTAVAEHPVGALLHNGEQLRKSNRLTVFFGYAPEPESVYGPGPGYVRLEILDVGTPDSGRTWVIKATDIQRFAKRRVFEGAASATPFNIGPDHPISIGLKVLTSTGTGTNGPYDVLPEQNGVGVPVALIDVAGLEALRVALPGIQFQFSEIEPQDAKVWVESQIFWPLNLIPALNQRGQYGAKRFKQPVFARSGVTLWRTSRAA